MTAITVFGGSRIEPETDEYLAAMELGRGLARRGLTVVTGGYHGVMEAVSRGAKEGGGHVIGVTVEVIARNFQRLPNAYLDQEVRTVQLLERIDKMVELGAGYVVLPGGAGTLAELSIVWNLAQLGVLRDRPLVVVGRGWARVLRTMVEELHAIEADLGLVRLVPDVHTAVSAIAASLTAET